MSASPTPASAPESRLARLLALLACPRCRGGLHPDGDMLHCEQCAARYPVRNGVPILLPDLDGTLGTTAVSSEDRVSRHPYGPRSEELIERFRDGWVLDLGAGGKLDRRPQVVQLDIFRYPMTDVVGTADCLPFRDNAFDAVISQAVFEHLRYPEWAAAEIRRVLKPGGIAKIDTAFLQPEHGYPHHFYNATETGLQHWFRDFEITWSGVEPYQDPKWSLLWFLDVYLDTLPADAASVLRAVPLGRLLDLLKQQAEDARVAEADLPVRDALDALPQHLKRTLAAGVAIQAKNPPKHAALLPGVAGASGSVSECSPSRDRLRVLEREQASLAQSLQDVAEERRTLREQAQLAEDRTRYLTQFFPGSGSIAEIGLARWLVRHAASVMRHALPRTVWFWLRQQALRGLGRRDPAGGAESPLVTFIVEPGSARSLIDAFFSLVRQDYTGWELLILETPAQTPDVRRAAFDFHTLDRRVRTLPVADPANRGAAERVAHGRLIGWLPDGGYLAFDALSAIAALLADRPQTACITADYDRAGAIDRPPLRCYNAPLSESGLAFCRTQRGSRAGFSLSSRSACAGEAALSPDEIAHIPRVLCHF